MFDEWYYRSFVSNNRRTENEYNRNEDMFKYQNKYRNLKRKLRFLIYENECFQEALRSTQRQLLKVNRDKSFLLDRLLYYEKVNASLTESDDETDSSADEIQKIDHFKRKKTDLNATKETHEYLALTEKCLNLNRKKKPILKSMKITNSSSVDSNNVLPSSFITDGHMTPEEVERHLESRQNYLELVPEKAPPTVPTEMFSNEALLDKLE